MGTGTAVVTGAAVVTGTAVGTGAAVGTGTAVLGCTTTAVGGGTTTETAVGAAATTPGTGTPGIIMRCPARMFVPVKPFAAWSAATLTPARVAMLNSVSPCFTM